MEALECYKLQIIISKNQWSKNRQQKSEKQIIPTIFVPGQSNFENLRSPSTDIGWFSVEQLTNQCQLKHSEGQQIMSEHLLWSKISLATSEMYEGNSASR